VEITCQQDATDDFYPRSYFFSTCFGHHYAHYQELESIIQVVAACGSNYLYNTLELLMMGIVVPETC
jgi:hypothetical protein